MIRNTKPLCAVFLVAASVTGDDLTYPPEEELNPNTWYYRYPAYPPYCSTPSEMSNRIIPMVRDRDPLIGETRIVHATAVIRHGARTPWSSHIQCWDGFWDSKDTGVWDCDLTTIMAPPSPEQVDEEEDKESASWWDTDNSFFLFEK